MKPFFIIASIVIFLGGVAYYLFVYLPSKNTSKDEDANITNGNGNGSGSNNNIPPTDQISVISLGKGSVLITSGVTQNAVNFGYAINESNLASYNIGTSPGSNPKLIHYVLPWNQSCFSGVWYKGWLYAYRGFTQDANSGTKTCY